MVKCSKCNNYSKYDVLSTQCPYCEFLWIASDYRRLENDTLYNYPNTNKYYYIVYEEIDSSMIPSVFYAMIEGSPFVWLNKANEHYDLSLRVNIRFYSEVTKEEYDSFKGLTF